MKDMYMEQNKIMIKNKLTINKKRYAVHKYK